MYVEGTGVDYFGVLGTRWKGLVKNVLSISSIGLLMRNASTAVWQGISTCDRSDYKFIKIQHKVIMNYMKYAPAERLITSKHTIKLLFFAPSTKNCFSWFQASAAKSLRTALSWVIKRQLVVNYTTRCVTTPKSAVLNFMFININWSHHLSDMFRKF